MSAAWLQRLTSPFLVQLRLVSARSGVPLRWINAISPSSPAATQAPRTSNPSKVGPAGPVNPHSTRRKKSRAPPRLNSTQVVRTDLDLNALPTGLIIFHVPGHVQKLTFWPKGIQLFPLWVGLGILGSIVLTKSECGSLGQIVFQVSLHEQPCGGVAMRHRSLSRDFFIEPTSEIKPLHV